MFPSTRAILRTGTYQYLLWKSLYPHNHRYTSIHNNVPRTFYDIMNGDKTISEEIKLVVIKILKKKLTPKWITAILIVVILGIVCSIAYNRLNPKEKLLNDNEINSFVQEKDIEPVLIQQVGESFTAIVYRDKESNEEMLYCLYKNRKGRLETQKYLFMPFTAQEADEKVYISGTSAPSASIEPYLSIVIRDREIYENAYKVTVLYNNGNEETALCGDNNRVILPATRNYFWQKPIFRVITISGKNDEILYKCTTSPDLP